MRAAVLALVLMAGCDRLVSASAPGPEPETIEDDGLCRDEFFNRHAYNKYTCTRPEQKMDLISDHEIICRCPERE